MSPAAVLWSRPATTALGRGQGLRGSPLSSGCSLPLLLGHPLNMCWQALGVTQVSEVLFIFLLFFFFSPILGSVKSLWVFLCLHSFLTLSPSSEVLFYLLYLSVHNFHLFYGSVYSVFESLFSYFKKIF